MYVYRNFKSPARYSLSCRGPSGKCIQMTRLLLRSGVSISLFFSISNKTTFLERWRCDGFFDSLGGRFSTIFFYPFVIDVTTVLKTCSSSEWAVELSRRRRDVPQRVILLYRRDIDTRFHCTKRPVFSTCSPMNYVAMPITFHHHQYPNWIRSI